MQRRRFLQLGLWTLLTQPTFSFATPFRRQKLILIELSGGNDSLNTVIPYQEPLYYRFREKIALKNANPISESLALNPNLKYLKKLYEQEEVAIVNGLGYDQPNRSHFRSIEIVETASNEYLEEGWISKAIQSNNKIDAIVLGKNFGNSLFSSQLNVVNFLNAEQFIKQSKRLQNQSKSDENDTLNFVLQEYSKIIKANALLKEKIQVITVQTPFEKTNISRDFKELAKIIASGLDVSVFKLTQSGYDTHTDQVKIQNKLLKELDNAIGSFVKEMKMKGLYEDLVLMTYSEFGRRVKENGSQGTDHGTAASHFVIGSPVNGGIYGAYPSLEDLDDHDDLKYSTHFQSYYNTFLKNYFHSNFLYPNHQPLQFL